MERSENSGRPLFSAVSKLALLTGTSVLDLTGCTQNGEVVDVKTAIGELDDTAIDAITVSCTAREHKNQTQQLRAHYKVKTRV